MVGFDGGGSSSARFHHVRIKGALYQEFHIFQLIGFFLEGMNEFSADGFTLLFRFRHALQEGHEMLGCVDVDQFHVEFIFEGVHYLFCFAQTEETVVYKDAGELVADGLMHQHGSYGRVYAAGKGADDVVLSYLSRMFSTAMSM